MNVTKQTASTLPEAQPKPTSANLDQLFPVPKIEIHYIPTKIESKIIGYSGDAYDILRKCWSHRIGYIEEIYVLLLNTANQPMGFHKLFQGSYNKCLFDPMQVLKLLIAANCDNFILAHNHPSGNLKPSPSDIRMTEEMHYKAYFMDFKLRDHIILSPDGRYYSFEDNGLL